MLFLWRYEPVRCTGKSDDWLTIFFCSHNKVDCSEIPIVLSNLLYHYFFHWIMAHFNFLISQNAKWGHAGFYIDRHRMTSLLTCAWLISTLWLVLRLQPKIKICVPENILLQKSTGCSTFRHCSANRLRKAACGFEVITTTLKHRWVNKTL